MIDNQSPSGTVVSSSLGRGNASSVDIIKQLDKLEELIEDSIQFLGRAVFINTEQFFTYTNKIRAFLPEELKWASHYSQESERMMLESETQARTAIVAAQELSLIHISEPTRLLSNSYAVFCLKKKKQLTRQADKIHI